MLATFIRQFVAKDNENTRLKRVIDDKDNDTF